MEVVLQIIAGPDQGQEFRFQESDNLLVGRKDPTSKAHMNLSPEDEYVSRHHFMIEVRPPNCLIRDQGSVNGTFVRCGGKKDFERIQETTVEDGDEIKVGHTILRVQVLLPEPVAIGTRVYETPTKVMSGPHREEAQPEVFCIRCGEQMPVVQFSAAVTLRGLDFMCPDCRHQAEVDLARESAAKAAVEHHCRACSRNLTQTANADGRAAELSDVACYLCQPCAERACQLAEGTIGPFLPLRRLGQGGMGVVYEAWHQPTGRVTALKLIIPKARSNDQLVARFLREMCIQGELIHTGVIRLYEAGRHEGDPFFVSELAGEGSMDKFVSNRGEVLLDPDETVRLVADSLDGLIFFHGKGYIHRDIKPENILLQKHNGVVVPKLADFGLARSFEKHGGTITRTGESCGTLYYMPPEQLTAFKRCLPPVDIYAMGVVLYYLLTARFPMDFPPPYEGFVRLKKDPVRMILEDPQRPVRQRRSDLSPQLCAVVDQAVAKDAGQRYQSATQLQAALRSTPEGS